ncbi:MAG TPA: sigma factor-like helix-turn-helix DNA-binding protein [Candidatus Saccharimonadales bacterium]|nr:sigma factor-like helix-turn-helix DNA-binding protein [Candidatus Saccharimonadales bacterium]
MGTYYDIPSPEVQFEAEPMVHRRELPMPQVEFEDDLDAQARQIQAITGIMPDARLHFRPRPGVPLAEMQEMIAGAKAGDPTASEALIATRLSWIYKYAQRDEIATRDDLTLEDVMHMGCLATLEGARRVKKPAKKNAVTIFANAVAKIMDHLMTESKLLPPVSSKSKKVLHGLPPGDFSPVEEAVEPVEDPESETGTLNRLVAAESYGISEDEILDKLLLDQWLEQAGLTHRERKVLNLRTGLGLSKEEALEEEMSEEAPSVDEFSDEEFAEDKSPTGRERSGAELLFDVLGRRYADVHTLDEAGYRLGLTKERIRQIETYAIDKLYIATKRRYAFDLSVYAESQAGTEQADREVKGDIPQWTDEQLKLQHRWFEEIKAKQEAGEIAFVRGSLLLERLPKEIEEYLKNDVYGGAWGGAALRRALQAVRIARDPELRAQTEAERSRQNMWFATARASRAYDRIERLEGELKLARSQFEQALNEGAEAIRETGLYPERETEPEK